MAALSDAFGYPADSSWGSTPLLNTKYLAPFMGHGCLLPSSFLGTSTALLVCCLRWMSYIDDVAAIQSGFVLGEISKSGLPDLYPLRLGER